MACRSDTRIVLLADSHLSDRAPECVSNWRAAASAASEIAPALTVHLGDISLDGDRHPDDLDRAADCVGRWPTRVACLPGNHDMGTGSGEQPLDHARLIRYLRRFGADRWIEQHAAWTLVGLNAQLMGSGDPAESTQRDWIERLADSLPQDARVALFLHRPLVRPPRETGMATGRYVAADAARRLLDGPLRRSLRIVFSGHTHQALDFVAGGVRHVWVPSSGFVIDDSLQAPVGNKQVGIGLLTLHDDEARYEPLLPRGMQEHELTRLACFSEFAAG